MQTNLKEEWVTLKVQLPSDFVEQYIDFANAADTTLEELVTRILKARFQEMADLLDFAKCHPEGSNSHDRAMEILNEYAGGHYVYAAMKEIDPAFEPFNEI